MQELRSLLSFNWLRKTETVSEEEGWDKLLRTARDKADKTLAEANEEDASGQMALLSLLAEFGVPLSTLANYDATELLASFPQSIPMVSLSCTPILTDEELIQARSRHQEDSSLPISLEYIKQQQLSEYERLMFYLRNNVQVTSFVTPLLVKKGCFITNSDNSLWIYNGAERENFRKRWAPIFAVLEFTANLEAILNNKDEDSWDTKASILSYKMGSRYGSFYNTCKKDDDVLFMARTMYDSYYENRGQRRYKELVVFLRSLSKKLAFMLGETDWKEDHLPIEIVEALSKGYAWLNENGGHGGDELRNSTSVADQRIRNDFADLMHRMQGVSENKFLIENMGIGDFLDALPTSLDALAYDSGSSVSAQTFFKGVPHEVVFTVKPLKLFGGMGNRNNGRALIGQVNKAFSKEKYQRTLVTPSELGTVDFVK